MDNFKNSFTLLERIDVGIDALIPAIRLAVEHDDSKVNEHMVRITPRLKAVLRRLEWIKDHLEVEEG